MMGLFITLYAGVTIDIISTSGAFMNRQRMFVLADGVVSSVVQRRLTAAAATESSLNFANSANVLHLANNDLEWRGERPRSEGLSVGSYRPILEVKCRSVCENGEIRRGDCRVAPAQACGHRNSVQLITYSFFFVIGL